MKHQIEMLDVKGADCFIINFFINDTPYLILVDAGNYSNGRQIEKHIKQYYDVPYIDLAIVTHPDKDHFGGFLYLLEQINKSDSAIRIGKFIVNEPGQHIFAEDVKRRRSDERTQKEANTVYDIDGHENLLDMIDNLGIDREELFDGDKIYFEGKEVIKILGPTELFYEELVPSLRHDLEPVDESTLKVFSTASPRNIDEEKDDESTHNASSLIFLFIPEGLGGRKYLFPGDATREALELAKYYYEDDMQNCHFLKVPHHGSIHNLTTSLIDHINPEYAAISAPGNEHHPADEIVTQFKRLRSNVFTTSHHGNMLFRRGTDFRKGWIHADPL